MEDWDFSSLRNDSQRVAQGFTWQPRMSSGSNFASSLGVLFGGHEPHRYLEYPKTRDSRSTYSMFIWTCTITYLYNPVYTIHIYTCIHECIQHMIVHSFTFHISHVAYQLETVELGHLSPGLALLGMVPRAGLLRCLGVIYNSAVLFMFSMALWPLAPQF